MEWWESNVHFDLDMLRFRLPTTAFNAYNPNNGEKWIYIPVYTYIPIYEECESKRLFFKTNQGETVFLANNKKLNDENLIVKKKLTLSLLGLGKKHLEFAQIKVAQLNNGTMVALDNPETCIEFGPFLQQPPDNIIFPDNTIFHENSTNVHFSVKTVGKFVSSSSIIDVFLDFDNFPPFIYSYPDKKKVYL